ncbi:MAG: hypothetical protein N2035_00120 [Chthoniobacterales bacterium]|nr:hypothetical protein [Chthoniobacterales bacterium]
MQSIFNSPPPYFLLLNSNTIVHPGCIESSVKAIGRLNKAGTLTCLLLNSDGSVQNICRRFPTPLREAACALGLPWKLHWLFDWADLEDMGWDQQKRIRVKLIELAERSF